MKKVISIGLAVALLLLAALTVWADPPVTKSTGKDAAPMYPAVDVYGEGSAYDNQYQIPGATGKVNMIQPNGNVDVILGVGMEGLFPNTQYKVFLDTDGHDNPGPWVAIGYFCTDDYGQGDFNYTLPAGELGEGNYTWSVFVNRTDINATILVSENVVFDIE
ncbi:MAG: hypothetical protein U9R72_02440 [Chloroflexota bacterium]|nr:hypothetical protein [Chloroflexota bacterium]